MEVTINITGSSEKLPKWQKYRLKDLEGYRKRKREWAKTPSQKEYRLNYMKKWREKNREKHNKVANESHRRNRYKHIEKLRNERLQKLYNITQEDYLIMLENQNNKCLICGRDKSNFIKGLHVDHNHTTGEVRGLLCSNCNGSLGWYEKCNKEIKSYLKEIV
jgi:hypothetical protein